MYKVFTLKNCTKQLTLEKHMLVSKTFGEYEVTFSIIYNRKVYFEINGSYKYEGNNLYRVAITRWLLKCFKEAQSEYPYLWCSPFDEDGMGDYRATIFQRVGFIPDSEGRLEWYPKKVLPKVEKLSMVEKTDYYHRKEGRLDVIANIGEWYTSIALPFRYKDSTLIVTTNVGDWYKAILIPS